MQPFLPLPARAPRALAMAWVFLLVATSARAIDCNQNGLDDSQDLLSGFSQDCNGNLVPDECEVSVQQRLLGEVPFLSTVMPADLDQDGDLDLIASSLLGLYWYENVHPDSLLVSHLVATSNSPARSLRAADMNGDGHTDIISDLGSTLRIHLGNGASPPSYTLSSVPTVLGHLDVIQVADLDGNGQRDLVALDTNDDVLLMLLQSGGTYQSHLVQGVSEGIVACAPGDLNGDGETDLVLADYDDDRVLALLGNGAPLPAFDTVILSQTLAGALDVKMADMDGDQDPDLVVAAYEDQEIVLLRNLGGFLPIVQRETVHTGAQGLWSLDIADMDGDGDQDLLSAHKLTSNVWLHTSSGGSQPTFLSQVIGQGILFVEEVYHGDTDRDGLPDIVVPSRTDHEVLGFSHFVIDCNNNGVADWCDIDSGSSTDCNANGRPDECEQDCNGNGLPDICDVPSGYSRDMNFNGLPDECEKPAAPQLGITLLEGPSLLVQWTPVDIATSYRVEMTLADGEFLVLAETTATSLLLEDPYTAVGVKFSLRVVASSARP